MENESICPLKKNQVKLLIVGSNSEYAIEKHYLKHLADNIAERDLEFFPAQQMFLDYYNQSLLHKVIYRLGLSKVLNAINRKLKAHIASFRPDVVLVFKGMEIYPQTLQYIKKQGIKLVNYNADNPFVFTGRGSGNRNITNSIGIYDAFISYDKGICEIMERKHKVKSYCIPFGYEPFRNEVAFHSAEILRVCFIGNGDSRRLDFLNQLAAKGLKIDLYGAYWKLSKLHDNIKLFPSKFGKDFIECIQKYRVQLNLMRIHNPDSHNMRTFEIAGYGGLQLAPKTEDHSIFFQSNREIFLFNSIDDCVEKANLLLQLEKSQADELCKNAQLACETKGYSYENRTLQLLESLKDVFNA